MSFGSETFRGPIRDEKVAFSDFGFFGILAPGDFRKDDIHARDVHVASLGEVADGSCKLYLRMRLEYWWEGGFDSQEMTWYLEEPSTNGWQMLRQDQRHHEL